VLQTGYACSIDGPPKSAVARGVHALTLLIANKMERDLKLLDGKVEVHVAPHLCPLDVSPFNFDHFAALIERAADHTRAWLEPTRSVMLRNMADFALTPWRATHV
jgi:NTE family protein